MSTPSATTIVGTPDAELVLRGVTAAIDPAGATAAVLHVAHDLGSRLQLPTRLLHVTDGADGRRWATEVAARAELELSVVAGDPVVVLAARARRGDELLVLGIWSLWDDPRGPGHVTRATLLAATHPVVLVPTDHVSGAGIGAVLVALDDDPDAAAALAPTLARLARAGCALEVVHVVDSAETPACLDHDGREAHVWRAEYVARHRIPHPLVVRRGDPVRCLLEEADPATIGLLVMAWRGRLDAGRAAVMQEVLRRVRVPTLVVPMAEARSAREGTP